MRVASPSRIAFAGVMIAIGIAGLFLGGFMPVWSPVPKTFPARDALAYLCDVVSIGCGVGLVVPRAVAIASRVLFGYLVVWMLVFRFGDIIREPGVFGAWDGCAETIVIVAGAWVLTGTSVRIARVLYGIAMIPFGLAHFLFVKETAALVPNYLPAHVVWVYVTGSAFLAAGAAVLTNIAAPLAAALSALQIGLFTLLVWVPVVAAGSKTPFVWSEFGISTALAAAAWVVADSYAAPATARR
jgi:uncharacterized membrane protein